MLCSDSAMTYAGCMELDFPEGIRSGYSRTLRLALSAFRQLVAPHDLQQAGMIGEAECLGGLGDMPVVPLEAGDAYLPLRLCLQRLERPWRRRGIGGLVTVVALNLRRSISGADGLVVRGDDHPFETVSQLSDVVLAPVVSGQQVDR